MSNQTPIQTPSQGRNKRPSRSYTPVGTRSRAKSSAISVTQDSMASTHFPEIQPSVEGSIIPPQPQVQSLNSTALQVPGSMIPLRPSAMSVSTLSGPLNRAPTIPEFASTSPVRAYGPSTAPSTRGQSMFGGGSATVSSVSSQFTPSLAAINGLVSAVQAEPSSYTFDTFIKTFPLPAVSYFNKGVNATFDLQVSNTIGDLDCAFKATIQEMFAANYPIDEIQSLRHDFLSLRSAELETLMRNKPAFDPKAMLLQKIEATKSRVSIPQIQHSSSDTNNISYSQPTAGEPQSQTEKTDSDSSLAVTSQSSNPLDHQILIGNELYDGSAFLKKYFSSEDAAISSNSVMILRSFLDPSVLSSLPSATGHTASSFAPLIVTSFFRSRPDIHPTRYEHFVKMPPKSMANLMICSFYHPLNQSGFNFVTFFGDRYHNFGHTSSVFEMFQEVVTFLADTMSLSFHRLLTEILAPARNLACHAPPALVLELLSYYFSIGLSVFSPLKIPISSHIGIYLEKHSLLNPGHLDSFKVRLQSLMLHSLTQNLASAKIPKSNPPRALPSGKSHTNAKPRISLRNAMGPCQGYCFSTFFSKACPRLKAQTPCVVVINGVSTSLKHHLEFSQLPVPEQQKLTAHFNTAIKPLMSDTQVTFYSP